MPYNNLPGYGTPLPAPAPLLYARNIVPNYTTTTPTGGTGTSVASGAAGGAAAGSAFGPYGTAIGAGVGALSSYFGSKRQAEGAENATRMQVDAQTRAADQQNRANQQALDLEREQQERERMDAAEADRLNYNNYRRRAMGAQNLGSAFGINLGIDIPEYGSKLTSSRGGQNTSQFSGEDASLGEMLRSGMDPAQAISQFNQRYGRTTGNEATFAHDNTIAVPTGYYSTGQNGWQFAGGDHGGGSGGKMGGTSGRPSLNSLASLYGQPIDPTQGAQIDPLRPPPLFRLGYSR